MWQNDYSVKNVLIYVILAPLLPFVKIVKYKEENARQRRLLLGDLIGPVKREVFITQKL
jgi:hypothetical protein